MTQMMNTASSPASRRATGKIAEILERFVAGFNTNDLDEVMAFFAADAVYQPGDGLEHCGTSAIREAFLPQFAGAYGTMRFVVDDQVVDEEARKATIRWVCQHDFTSAKPVLARMLFTLRYGRHAGWYGTDTFHFDEDGRIVGKFSYANFGARPHLRRDLGAHLLQRRAVDTAKGRPKLLR